MKIKTNLYIFIVSFLIAGFLFQTINTELAGAIAVVPGCCTTEEGGGECVACPEGDTCFASSTFCVGEDLFFSSVGACVDDGEGAMCVETEPVDGCCVIEPGNCVNEIDIESCFIGQSEFPDIFVSGQSCGNVPQCIPTRNVPTLSNWGLIALAAVLVLVGIWAITRKKATA